MTSTSAKPTIPESYLEHRQNFANAWVDIWNNNNPFISLLFSLLRASGVELTDIGFNKDPSSVGEVYLNIAIRKLNATIRVGLDSVTYIVGNPDWSMAPSIVELFDVISLSVQKLTNQSPDSQQFTLAFHVIPGDGDLKEKTSQLVHTNLIGDASFYGMSAYREDGFTIIDKSLRHEGAAFIRLQRRFSGNVSFAEMAPQIYADEMKALNLLGIKGID